MTEQEIEELMLRAIDGDISAQEQAELDVLLNDELHVQGMMDLMDLHADLMTLSWKGTCKTSILKALAEQEQRQSMKKRVLSDIHSGLSERKRSEKKSGSRSFISFRYTMLAAVAVVLIGVSFFLVTGTSESIGQISVASDGATIYRNNKYILPTEKSSVELGDIIAAEEELSLLYGDNTAIRLDAQSIVEMRGSQSQKGLFLRRGSLRATVQPQEKAFPFILHTPDLAVQVVGTEFTLQANDSRSSIRLIEGHVHVTDKEKKEYALTTGQGLFVQDGRTRWLGSISDDDFSLLVQGTFVSEIDISRYNTSEKEKKRSIEEHPYLQHIYVSEGDDLNRFVCGVKDKPLFTGTEDMVCHVTFRTDGQEKLFLTFDKMTTPSHVSRIHSRKQLSRTGNSIWQTLSFPLAEFSSNGLSPQECLVEGEYRYIQIHAQITPETKKQYLEIGAIWFTSK